LLIYAVCLLGPGGPGYGGPPGIIVLLFVNFVYICVVLFHRRSAWCVSSRTRWSSSRTRWPSARWGCFGVWLLLLCFIWFCLLFCFIFVLFSWFMFCCSGQQPYGQQGQPGAFPPQGGPPGNFVFFFLFFFFCLFVVNLFVTGAGGPPGYGGPAGLVVVFYFVLLL
jgi:hypothetical protein